jgi:hypothetical protein
MLFVYVRFGDFSRGILGYRVRKCLAQQQKKNKKSLELRFGTEIQFYRNLQTEYFPKR